jgi:hypothetical protein
MCDCLPFAFAVACMSLLAQLCWFVIILCRQVALKQLQVQMA